jgi:osmotically-inducible protein OsmY
MRNVASNISDTVTDTAITTKIKAKFAMDDLVSTLDVNVVTDQGKVTLKGTVPNRETADRAVTITRDTDGVHEVIDNLEIRS